ncbi:hypothetical protein Dalk_2867 [Desulfatibacillum aliphaticivorans]|uniref:Uncharacterized protein n=1 Tax=Desulfatibacillum aliphaticivorans TaxID=218208 RepID=B8FBB3_DESAL|nr:hypothetical protein [Desulfatibacillum aliphaticivorans]ACL04557.1 hypothetical protein Dalk_2867 [Desulfatibacillum aliphaticivorans]
MRKRLIIAALTLACIHFALLFGSIVIAFGATMERFDDSSREKSCIERIADHAADILIEPAKSIFTPWMSVHTPTFVEWGILLINSLIWGILPVLIAAGMRWVMMRKFQE